MAHRDQPSKDLSSASSDNAGTPAAARGGSPGLRLGWMLVGPAALLISGMFMASQPPWTFGLRDLAFWAAVVACGVMRYLDVTRHNGETTDGQPATRGDLLRHLLGLAVLSAIFWGGAQSIQL